MKLSDVQKENGSSEIAKKVCKLLKKEWMRLRDGRKTVLNVMKKL